MFRPFAFLVPSFSLSPRYIGNEVTSSGFKHGSSLEFMLLELDIMHQCILFAPWCNGLGYCNPG